MFKKILSAGVTIIILFTICTLNVAAASDAKYSYEPIDDYSYKVMNGNSLAGYVLIGGKSALVICVNENITSLPGFPQDNSLDLEFVNTKFITSHSYKLGNRTINAVTLNGFESLAGIKYPTDRYRPVTSIGYVDSANNLLFTSETVGSNGYALVGDSYTHKVQQYGKEYFNMLEFQSSVNKVAKLLNSAPDPVIYDGNGNSISSQYLRDIKILTDKVMEFDNSLVFKYDLDKAGSYYKASYGSATLEFYNPLGGFLGYALAQTSILDKTYIDTRFFTVKYRDGFYHIKDTDLNNTYLLVGDEDALPVDTDMYNGTDQWTRIKNIIGDRNLSVYITHGHADHWDNLQYYDGKQIQNIYFPENEIAAKFGDNKGVYNLIEDFEKRFKDKVVYVNDGDTFHVADRDFEVISVTGHTNYGTALLNATNRQLFSGDTLGTQIYLGGTRVQTSTLNSWVDGVDHLADVIKYGTPECRIDEIFAGHSPVASPVEWIEYMKTIVHSIQKSLDVICSTPAGNLVVTRNGKILTQSELNDIFKNDVADAYITEFASISYLEDRNITGIGRKDKDVPQ